MAQKSLMPLIIIWGIWLFSLHLLFHNYINCFYQVFFLLLCYSKLLQALPQALARQRSSSNTALAEVHQFLIGLSKYNDNSVNRSANVPFFNVSSVFTFIILEVEVNYFPQFIVIRLVGRAGIVGRYWVGVGKERAVEQASRPWVVFYTCLIILEKRN